MEITGSVHCFFEQSGTFKNEFKRLGYEAYDYDSQNNFGETDYQIDLFTEIEKGYDNQPSIFDKIGGGDLIMAFFPCIYFAEMSMMFFGRVAYNFRGKSPKEITDKIIKRADDRVYFYKLINKLVGIVQERGLRMIIENPASLPHYLLFDQNFIKPTFIDKDRSQRGDYFKKPTAYWFINCEPTYGLSLRPNRDTKTIERTKSSLIAGQCSEERSMISPTYARNFICDFILGIENENSLPKLF